MVERMNRTIKESTIKAYEYEGLEQLREHVQAFVQSYNFGKHLKALRWKTPFRAMCEAWEKEPSRFRLHPHQFTVGLNILVPLYTHPAGDSSPPTAGGRDPNYHSPVNGAWYFVPFHLRDERIEARSALRSVEIFHRCAPMDYQGRADD